VVKLDPAVTRNFSVKDLAFVTELSKVGYVHLHSSQVSLVSEFDKGLTFKAWSSNEDLNCAGLSLPENWTIEGIYQSGDYIRMTFGVAPQK